MWQRTGVLDSAIDTGNHTSMLPASPSHPNLHHCQAAPTAHSVDPDDFCIQCPRDRTNSHTTKHYNCAQHQQHQCTHAPPQLSTAHINCQNTASNRYLEQHVPSNHHCSLCNRQLGRASPLAIMHSISLQRQSSTQCPEAPCLPCYTSPPLLQPSTNLLSSHL